MKKLLITGILLAGTASAFALPAHTSALDVSWSSKCSSYGELKVGVNPSRQHVNCLLTAAALANSIPPEVLKSVAVQENENWVQYNSDGSPFVSTDNGIGLMQLTNQPQFETSKLENDLTYNIQAGAEHLNSMYHERTDLPKTTIADQKFVIENWYFPIMAYNGIKPVNSPIVKSPNSPDYGKINRKAYQEEVSLKIVKNEYMESISLAQYPFTLSDFEYDPNSERNIQFTKKLYVLSGELHESNYTFSAGSRVKVTDNVNVRQKPDTQSTLIKTLTTGTELVVTGPFAFTEKMSNKNQFVWYPVKTTDNKISGYVSSAYLKKMLIRPVIHDVDDNDTSISGSTLPNSEVTIQFGASKKVIYTDSKGIFKTTVQPLRADTIITAFYKDSLNRLSPLAETRVFDKTPPSKPIVNPISSISVKVTGKAEAYSTIEIKSGKTTIGKAKTDASGKFSASIKNQAAGLTLRVFAADASGNISEKTEKVIADKTPPVRPVISTTITTKTTTVSGTAEKNSIVTLKAGKHVIGTKKADAYGKFKIIIKPQKSRTVIFGTAKDAAGNVSSPYKVTVK
ncbi:Ig-like domain-containing protein [Fictibacillus iocasae]|uniref:Ig-like domain-containing protein n=1 Tax=Fictibacillus iocasae TaxID=2715437 RepID=A0ABW2NS03_9BACL